MSDTTPIPPSGAAPETGQSPRPDACRDVIRELQAEVARLKERLDPGICAEHHTRNVLEPMCEQCIDSHECNQVNADLLARAETAEAVAADLLATLKKVDFLTGPHCQCAICVDVRAAILTAEAAGGK